MHMTINHMIIDYMCWFFAVRDKNNSNTDFCSICNKQILYKNMFSVISIKLIYGFWVLENACASEIQKGNYNNTLVDQWMCETCAHS